jgi:hypothetical protein
MPLPLLIPIILGGIGAVSAAVGVGKGIKAAVDNNDAEDYNRWANDTLSEAKDRLGENRKATNAALK